MDEQQPAPPKPRLALAGERKTSGRVTMAEAVATARQLLIQGVSEWRIRRDFTRGVLCDTREGWPADLHGRTLKFDERRVREILQRVGDDWLALTSDPMVHERMVGAVVERLSRIAAKAEADKQYGSAISANNAILRVTGAIGPTRFRRLAGVEPEVAPERGAANPYAELTEDELKAQVAERRARLARYGLDVIDGGAKSKAG